MSGAATSGGAEERCDLLVVGSGGAALTAAAVAASRGVEVLLVERGDAYGGTTALSGGRVWVPGNHHQQALGLPDSPADARAYLRAVTGTTQPDLLEAFVAQAPRMAGWVEAHTPHRFAVCERYLDYHPRLAGATAGGRALDAEPYAAGDLAGEVLANPSYVPVTHAEWERWRRPGRYDQALLQARRTQQITTNGLALVCALLAGCRRLGAATRLRTRATGLLRDGDRVTGALAETSDGPLRVHARRGVVLAAGGFDWDTELRAAHLPGPVTALGAPPTNTGDALTMATRVGARRGGLRHAWLMPMLQVPGETLGGAPYYRSLVRERSLPGCLMVNRAGRRFTNEALPYNELVKAMHRRGPDQAGWPNLPAWLVVDERFRSRYGLATIQPGRPVPGWVPRGDTLAELAGAVGVDRRGLEATVAAFNTAAGRGEDPEWGRGESPFDRYGGDPEVGPNPTLAPLESPPYFAVEVLPGTIGTKGGLVTDAAARVLDTTGAPVPGLWACGNTAAGWLGDGYPGPGATLGVAMTSGYLAALDATA